MTENYEMDKKVKLGKIAGINRDVEGKKVVHKYINVMYVRPLKLQNWADAIIIPLYKSTVVKRNRVN